MRRPTREWVWAGVLLLSGIASVAVIAADLPSGEGDGGGFGHHGRHGMRGGHMMKHMLQSLDLSADQQATVRGIFAQARPEFEALGDARRENRSRLMNTSPNDPDYDAVVNEVSQASADLAQRMVELTSQVRRDVYQVLTPEQQTELEEKKAEMREQMRRRIEERMGVVL